MITFTEWIKDTDKLQGLSGDIGMQTAEEPDLLESQMEQMADRINGMLFNLSQEQKAAILDRFISKLSSRVNNEV